MFQEASFRNKRDPLQRVYGYVDFWIELSQSPIARQGCLLGNFSQELSDTEAYFLDHLQVFLANVGVTV